MSNQWDVIVIGAGIVGAACAEACAASGLRVLVVDRAGVGGGVTAAGMGHVVVMDDSPAQLALTKYSRDLWRSMSAEGMSRDVEFDPCGTLWVAADDEEMAEVVRKKSVCDEHAVAAEVWDGVRLAHEEPKLRPGLAGALKVVDDGVIYPPTAARYLLERGKKTGRVEVRLGAPVKGVLAEGGVEIDGERITCTNVIVAAGAWTPALMLDVPGTKGDYIVKKRKGHLVITDRYPGYVKHQIVELGYLKSAHSVSADSVAFNIQPRKTGQMLLGSSRQYGAEGLEVDASILTRMIRRCEEYLPDVGRLSAIRVWTGHRPATPDKLPLIGRSVESEHVWLATGHEGLGITTSVGTGRLVTDLLLGKPTAIDAAPYSPSRANHEDSHDHAEPAGVAHE